MTISLPAKAAQSRETMAVEDESYDRRLNELTEEMEIIKRDLGRACQVLRTDAGLDNSSTSCEAIITALGNLRQSEAAKILDLTSETHRIADKMSYAIRVRAAERVLSKGVLGDGDSCPFNFIASHSSTPTVDGGY